MIFYGYLPMIAYGYFDRQKAQLDGTPGPSSQVLKNLAMTPEMVVKPLGL